MRRFIRSWRWIHTTTAAFSGAFLLGLVMPPPAARAQTCSNGVTCGIPLQYYNMVSSPFGGDNGDSFVTKHGWKQKAAGTLALDGTGFTIAFDVVTFTYALQWRGKEIAHDVGLDAMKRMGVSRAVDMQAVGVPLE